MKSIEQVFNLGNQEEIILGTVLCMLLENAKNKNATHILIEPETHNHRAAVYYMLAGQLEPQFYYPAAWYTLLRGRIKLYGNIDIGQRERTQSGAGAIEYKDRKYKILVSSIPFEDVGNTWFNESLIIAFNDSSNVKYPAEDTTIRDCLQKLHGRPT